MNEINFQSLHLDDAPFAAALKNQILSLLIDFTVEMKPNATEYVYTCIYTNLKPFY
jgi:hypothetical protein